jgi:fatty-acyl-CoA synthase
LTLVNTGEKAMGDDNAPNAPHPEVAQAASPARAWLRALENTAEATSDPHRILPRAVADWARSYADAPALVSDRECFSFRDLEKRMNQYSRWALAEGIQKSETVALMMGNRPEYFVIWLGLIQVGAVVALLGSDLRAPAIAHALKAAGARRIIASAECADVCRSAVAALGEAAEIWIHGSEQRETRSIELAAQGASGDALTPDEVRSVTLNDRALRIFTSGTTGLPKAAEVSHRRLVTWIHWFASLAGLTTSDRLYNCLPMHHSVGGVVAVGAPLVFGGSVVIADRFSARGFWNDVARWECTAFQYIGELCRYLLAAPIHPAEKARRVRIAIGNGLSQGAWRPFIDRFGPLRILEFYASTEGNVWLYNAEGKIGSVGRLPPYVAVRDPIALVRFDYGSQIPARGPDGFCVRCADGEVGEALGRIGKEPGARFEGYSEGVETERKTLRDVFEPGDAWMRTGDLMRRDADGFYTFVDRIGDTFRWKGENVSTSEIEAVLRACPGVEDAVVYGVVVPGADGRAGMALLKIDRQFDLHALRRRLEILPRYARPLFLRLALKIEITETFKAKRRAYVDEGFDPERIEDPLYVFDGRREAFVVLDTERYAAIRNRTIGF